MQHPDTTASRSLAFEALATAIGVVVERPHSWLDGMLLDGAHTRVEPMSHGRHQRRPDRD